MLYLSPRQDALVRTPAGHAEADATDIFVARASLATGKGHITPALTGCAEIRSV